MTKLSSILPNRRSVLATVAAGAMMVLGGAPSAHAAEKLRLSTTEPPESSMGMFAAEYAKRVGERSGGEIDITVYPANQLGDWVEIHEQMMVGAVDMSVQMLSNKFNDVLALQWFPYSVLTFDDGRKQFTSGGVVFDVVNEAIAEQDLQIIGTYVTGVGGLLYSNPPEDPLNPNTAKDRKIRVWPGATTHQALLERLGHQSAPIPWAEAFTALQTGVVDGLIGSTPELTLNNFVDVTKMWVQNNDHFEVSFININKSRLEGLSDAHRQIVLDVAAEMTQERFDVAEREQARFLQDLRDAGVEVIEMTDAQIAETAAIVRAEVWPEIQGEIGAANMDRLKGALGL
ncbi:TRAP transporter substrate-binding protein DctP [Thalassorhabdomicrobium marinisediminis]|uniref:TRAP transporter substrate-binding protein DctP n=1 Tax=Thalassorhabdomicrobium marinisediminis TaxID=2170577 RepID=UPI0024928803|nr:TRAP transporter substrate-binding protein DctP [Thalassorhabdomicrobium marinisediminis]